MIKYTKTLIDNYINGNDIENYSLEELENDKDFMMLVINNTNDEKIYNLCSDNVKKNYEFVKYIILKFQFNTNFICNVADYYLRYSSDEFSNTELIIIMNDLTIHNKDKNDIYRILSDAIHFSKRVEIECAKKELEDKEFVSMIGMGFILIFDSYNSSKYIVDFYAKKIIEDIFDENDIDLEKMLHNQFKTSEEIEQIALNKYLLDFIRQYDSMLSSYLSTNINLLSELKEKIKKVQSNWEKYNYKIECKKYELIIEKIHEYMNEVDFNPVFTETYILYDISKKLGIAEKMAKYDGISKELYDSIISYLDDEFIEEVFKKSPNDKLYYETIFNVVSSILNSNKIPESTLPSSDKKCKILKIDFKNTKSNN